MAGWAWNTGSGWVLRKTALRSIGGFPTDSLTEDVHSSLLMLMKGWKTATVAESLQWGLMPETFASHIKQRSRWVGSDLSSAPGDNDSYEKKTSSELRSWECQSD